MKVCLIIPPSSFLLDERVFPSLGILKVAAVLEQQGHSVHLLDLSGRAQIEAELFEHFSIEREPAEVIGITATMPQMPAAAEIAGCLRDHRPSARLILGGPHPTLMNASARLERQRGIDGRAQRAMAELQSLFDVIVAGDGEKAISRALSPDAPSLIDGDDPTSDLFLTKQDLNDAPWPARHLIDIESYRYQIDGVPTMSLIAQLGCPFGCNFCGGRRSPFLRRVRMRSTDHVLAEMAHLYETYGCRGFMFLDDELNVNTAFTSLLEGIIALQRRHGVKFRLRGLVKSELVTAPMAAQMYAAGFRQVLVGFESGSPRMLVNMNKHATIEDNTRCVQIFRDAGIKVKALMSFGHPGESWESVNATRDWLLTVRPDDFDVTIITVYPGTPYYDDAVENSVPGVYTYLAKNGDVLYAQHTDHLRDVNFYKGIPGQYQSFVWTEAMTAADLVYARDTVETQVRTELAIPWPSVPAAVQYEHSMGCR